eukprot:6202272-Pleurochrysis_carterae.AAC.4
MVQNQVVGRFRAAQQLICAVGCKKEGCLYDSIDVDIPPSAFRRSSSSNELLCDPRGQAASVSETVRGRRHRARDALLSTRARAST